MSVETPLPSGKRLAVNMAKHRMNVEIVHHGVRSLAETLNQILGPTTQLFEELQFTQCPLRPEAADDSSEQEEVPTEKNSLLPIPPTTAETVSPKSIDLSCQVAVGRMSSDDFAGYSHWSLPARPSPQHRTAFAKPPFEHSLMPADGDAEGERMMNRASVNSLPSLQGWTVSDADLVKASRSAARNSGSKTCGPLPIWIALEEELIAAQWEVMRDADAALRNGRKVSARKASYKSIDANLPGKICSWIVHPLSINRLVWDVVSVLVMAADIVFTPFQFAFNLEDTGSLLVVQWFGAVFWTLDVLMSFRTGYISSHGAVETCPTKVALHYCQSWLIVDLTLASLEWMGRVVVYRDGGGLNAARWTRFAKVGRGLRILRVMKIPGKLELFNEFIRSSGVMLCFSLLKMALVFMIMVHILTCGWYYVGQMTPLGWVYSEIEGVADGELPQQYVASTRFVLAQVNGRTDQKAGRTMREQMYIVLCGMVAVLFMSVFISGLTTRMVELQRLWDSQKKDMRILNKYLERHRSISWRVRHIAKHYVQGRSGHQNTVNEEEQVLKMLPEELKSDLLFEIRSPLLLSHMVIRTMSVGTSSHFVHALCASMRPVAAPSMTMVFSKGQPRKRVLIVEGGKCIYSTRGDLKQVIARWLEETVGFGDGTQSGNYVGGKLFKKLARRKTMASSQELHGNDLSQTCSFGELHITEGMEVVHDGAWLSEAALWMQWQAKGDLLSISNLTSLAMDIDVFQDVIGRHPDLLYASAVFAWTFLSQAQLCWPNSKDSSPAVTPTVLVTDYIEELERQRYYDIDDCPCMPMMASTVPATASMFGSSGAADGQGFTPNSGVV